MSKQLRLDVAQLTDVGRKRPHNEDNMAYVIPKDPQVMARKGALFIVSDGMGGHAAGEVASEIAVDTVSYSYYQDDSEDAATSLLHAIRRANSLIHQRAAENMLRSGMGTTCVSAVLRGNIAYIANVGDSRAYLVRHGQVKQVSQDHSWVAEQVRAGLLTEDQARSHAQRNVITRCLGTQSEVDVDVFTEQLEEGDTLVLCTDGLSGLVGDDELRVIVDQFVPQESVYHLVERANENGGPDNITAIVIRVQEVGGELSPRYPVRVGGRETGDDTALMGRLPTTPLSAPMRADDLRPGTFIPDTITAPQPAMKLPKTKQRRLLYPTLILVVILIVAVIGTGFYFFTRAYTSAVDVDGTLRSATVSIGLAKKDLDANPANPSDALQNLSQVRAKLLSLQDASRSSAQTKQYIQLRDTFVTTVQQANTTYNHINAIASLPCVGTIPTPIMTNLGATNLAVLQDTTGKKLFTYIVTNSKDLYPLNVQHTLDNKIVVDVGDADAVQAKVEAIANDASHFIVLFSLPKGNIVTYGVSLLLPQPSGSLKAMKSVTMTVPQGYTPKYVTIANNAVSVILASENLVTQFQVVNYTLINAGTTQSFNTPTTTPISFSKTIVSVVSLVVAQKPQLFFLMSDGSLQTLSLPNASGTPPSPVLLANKTSIVTPLAISSANFTLSEQNPVPTLGPITTSLSAVSVPGATLLATGADGHLYIVAAGVNGVSPRILDLQAIQESAATTGVVGGGVATQGLSLHVKLAQQYVSSSPTAKGLAVDPKGQSFYLLTPTGPNPTSSQLISVTLPLQKTCVS